MTKNETADLINKLSLKDTKDAFILHAPSGNSLPRVKRTSSLNELPESLTWVQVFYTKETDLTYELPIIKERLSKDGMLWVCWPKRTANISSDLTDNIVRSLGLASGLVDNKVASINDNWSGLKFVFRLSDR